MEQHAKSHQLRLHMTHQITELDRFLVLSLSDFLRMVDGHLVKRKGKAAASSTFTLHQ